MSNSEGLLPECSIGLNIKRLRVKTTQIELCMDLLLVYAAMDHDRQGRLLIDSKMMIHGSQVCIRQDVKAMHN